MLLRRRISTGKKVYPNGVYIQHANSKLYTRTEWNIAWNAEANGVAVITDNCKFVISPIDSTSPLLFGGYNVVINNVVMTTNSTIARKDYAGYSNTNEIITQLGYGNAPASEYCRGVTFKHGKKGYLGSLGEWQEAFNNKVEIDACMSLINGTAMYLRYIHVASTQYDAERNWFLNWGSPNSLTYDYKSIDGRVRAFSAL